MSDWPLYRDRNDFCWDAQGIVGPCDEVAPGSDEAVKAFGTLLVIVFVVLTFLVAH